MRRVLVAALGVALVAGCGSPDNTDPRKGRVTIDESNCLTGGCYWDYKVCIGPDLFVRVAGKERTFKDSAECSPSASPGEASDG